jgi:hypothetical protein
MHDRGVVTSERFAAIFRLAEVFANSKGGQTQLATSAHDQRASKEGHNP